MSAIETLVPGTALDCGHIVPERIGLGTGYAHGDGRSMCYPCADDTERAGMAVSVVWTGYVSDGGKFTTWPGGGLGTVTDSATGPWRITPSGGRWRQTSVSVRTPDGRHWAGRYNADSGNAVTVRVVRGGKTG